ncbi:MAG TPA: aldehyde ferredoxin oxidoreductase family protein [Chloroflexota bacterium]|nr:aldehyde ferredoxin oxidoreductase family protein [Chloroflexota bacterium]
MNGYNGKVLHVDLGLGRSWEEALTEPVLRAFIGGIGLGTYLLYQHCPAGVDPLSPANPLILATSPFAGTAITTTAKYAVLAKSPLTGFIGDSLSSSHLALELKRTGYDALVLHGACPRWSVLVIVDGAVELVPADPFLGLDTWATELAVRAQVGGGRVAAIGPAGEQLVRFATISNDGRHAGRTGTGAVMGAKRLKAIAVRGTRPVRVADPAGLQRANQALIARARGPATVKYRQLGTAANLLAFDRVGVLPSYNYRQATFAGAEQLSGEELHRQHLAKIVGCASCTVRCEHLYRTLDEGPEAAVRLEYETLYALGPLLGIADPNAVIRAAQLCDRLGLDSISAGGTLAWAMECYERGLLTPADTGGIALRFGNAAAVPAMLTAIAQRAGLGDLLAEGSRRAAARLGGGSEAWAMHVKGLELPGYEPRGLKTMALGLAVSPRGACHNRSAAYEVDFSGHVDRFQAEVSRGQLAAAAEDLAAVLDSLVLCKFIRKCFDDLYTEAATLYRLVTGWAMDGAELRRAGERINNLKKLFNIREGWTRADDTLPPRCLTEPLADGPGAGERLTQEELDLMIAGYYAARGWTADGLIPPEKLRELALDILLATPAGARAC